MAGHLTRAAVLVAAVGALLAGCAMRPGATSPDTSAAGHCPPVRPGSGHAAVDYVDFVQAHGMSYLTTPYLAGKTGTNTVTGREVGGVQFRVRCSLGTLNDLTHASPPAPRNHDAAFLRPGTPVHAVRGWSPLCRLVARHDGGWHVYLAQRGDTKVATAKDCALHRPSAAARR
jgi:hypothetical protein